MPAIEQIGSRGRIRTFGRGSKVPCLTAWLLGIAWLLRVSRVAVPGPLGARRHNTTRTVLWWKVRASRDPGRSTGVLYRDEKCAPGPTPGGHSRLRRLPLSGHGRSEEHTSELQSRRDLVCRLLLEKKKTQTSTLPQTKNPQQQTNKTTHRSNQLI